MLTHYILYRMVPSFLYPQSPNFISKHLTPNFIFCFSVMRFLSSKHLSLNPYTSSNHWTIPSELYKYPIHFEWVSLSILSEIVLHRGHQPPCANSNDILFAQFSIQHYGGEAFRNTFGFLQFQIALREPSPICFFSHFFWKRQ